MVFLNASGLVIGVLYPEIEFTTLGELSMLEGMIVFGYTHIVRKLERKGWPIEFGPTKRTTYLHW